jgi:hypothetical protein
MFTDDLTAEIQDLFDGAQAAHGQDIAGELARGSGELQHGGFSGRAPIGFHVIRGTSRIRGPELKSIARTEYKRAHTEKLSCERIAARLRAGEVPKALVTGHGRPPTRWLAIAAELGIDLLGAAAVARAALPATPNPINKTVKKAA